MGYGAVVLIICVMRVAKNALDKALAENDDIEGSTPGLPIVSESASDLNQPLVIKVEPHEEDNHEK